MHTNLLTVTVPGDLIGDQRGRGLLLVLPRPKNTVISVFVCVCIFAYIFKQAVFRGRGESCNRSMGCCLIWIVPAKLKSNLAADVTISKGGVFKQQEAQEGLSPRTGHLLQRWKGYSGFLCFPCDSMSFHHALCMWPRLSKSASTAENGRRSSGN